MALTAPVLTAGPADGSSSTSTTATFSWNAVATATGYKVSVDGSGSSSVGAPSQVGILIFENEAGSAVDSGNNPTFHALAAQYRNYSNLVAITHPSLPNYCAETSGSLLGKDGTDSGTVGFAGSAPNIFSQIAGLGKTWKTYEEGVNGRYTSWINDTTHSPYYASRHCPANFYTATKNAGVSHGTGRYDFDELLHDISGNSLPDFFYITPNLRNDAHNTTVPFADQWLQGLNPDNSTYHFPGITALIAAMRPDGVLFITFDEGSGTNQRIYTSCVGQRVTSSVVSTAQSHYSLLYGIQQNFGLNKFTEQGQNLASGYTSLAAGIPIPQTGSAGTGGIDLGTTRTYTTPTLAVGGHDFQVWAYDTSGDGPHTTVDWQVKTQTTGTPVIDMPTVIQEGTPWTIGDKEIGRVDAICYDPAHNIVYVGGNFHGSNSVQQKDGTKVSIDYLFAVDWATQELISSWKPTPDGRVYSIWVSEDGNEVWVGGAFTNIGSTPTGRHNFACLNPATAANAGTVNTSRCADLGFNGLVHRIAATPNGRSLFLGGDFTAPATTGTRLCKLDLTGTAAAIVSTWKPSAGTHVRALAVDPNSNRLFVGGDFTNLNGATRNYCGCIAQDSGGSLAFTFQAADRVLDACTDGTNVYMGTVNDLLVKCDFATGTQQWGAKAEDTDGNVQAVAYDSQNQMVVGGMHGDCVGNAVGAASGAYSGGSCGVATGVVRHKVWRQTASSGALDTVWDPSLTSNAGVLGVWSLETYADQVWMGGDFTSVKGSSRQRIAAIGTVSTPQPPSTGGSITQRAGTGFGEGTTSAATTPPSAYQAGDLLVAHVNAVGATAIQAPIGWAAATPVISDSTALASCVYTKTAVAGETAATFTCAGATSLTVYVTAWQGAGSVRTAAGAASTGAAAISLVSPSVTGLAATSDEVLTFAATTSGPRPYADSGVVFGAMDAATDWSTQAGIANIETVAGRSLAAAHSMVPWDCHVGATHGDFTSGSHSPTIDYNHNRLTYVSWPRPRPGADTSESSWQSVMGVGSDPTPKLQAIAAGTYDSIIDANAAAYKAFKHPFIMRLLWESNGGGIIWGIGKSSQQSAYNAAYIGACRRIIDRTRAVAKNVLFHWNPQNFQTVVGAQGSRDNQYWDDAHADLAGTEGYITAGSFSQLMTETSSNGATYQAIYSGYGLGSSHHKILGNGEGGNRWNNDDAAAAARIDSYRTDLPNYPDWRVFMWWNSIGTNGNSDITSQPTVCKTAFSNWLSQAYTRPRLNRSWLAVPQTQSYEDRRTLGSVGTCYGAGQQGATLIHTTATAASSSPVTLQTYGYGAHTSIQLALQTGVIIPPPPPPTGDVVDTWTRTTTNGWGTSDSGFAWTHASGNRVEVFATGTKGEMDFTTAGDLKIEALTPTAGVDFTTTDFSDTITFSANTSGADYHHGIVLRYTDSNNYYRLDFKVGDTTVDRIQTHQLVGGVLTALSSSVSLGSDFFVTGQTYGRRFQVDADGAMRARVWNTSGAEPGSWQVDLAAPASDPLPHGGVGYRIQVIAGGAAAPAFQHDSLAVTATAYVPTPVGVPDAPTFTSTPVDNTTGHADWLIQLDTTSTSAEYRLVFTGSYDADDGWKPLGFSPSTFQTEVTTSVTLTTPPETVTIHVRSSNANGTGAEASDDWTFLDQPPPPPPPTGGVHDWLYLAPNYVGCQWGVGPGPQKTKEGEVFAGRRFWIRTQGDGEAAFNPTGRNAAGQSVEPATDWSNDLADMAGTGTDLDHEIDVIFTIMGGRSSDATWPAAVGGDPWGQFAAWVYGDGSYVDTCVTAWANLIKSVPRRQLFRLWHEFGNATTTYGQGTPQQFVTYWQKVVTRLRNLGALTTANTDPLDEKGQIVWNPASHLNNPNDNFESFPGYQYVDWVGQDLYSSPGVGMPPFFPTNDPFYNAYNSVDGTRNPSHRPLILCENGLDQSDPNRVSKMNQWLQLLKTTKQGIDAVMWWDGSGNEVVDNPAGFRQAFQGLNDPFFLPDGIATATTPVTLTPTVTVQAPTSGTTVTGSSVAVRVAASEAGGGISSVVMRVNNGSAVTLSPSSVDANGNGVYIGTATLTTNTAPGAVNTINVSATDNQVPQSSVNAPTITVNAVSVVTDTTGPVITVTSPNYVAQEITGIAPFAFGAPHVTAMSAPTEIEGVDGTQITISGTVVDPSGVASLTITGGGYSGASITVGSQGQFSKLITLTTGSNTISLHATDSSPAANATTLSFVLALVDPVIPDVVGPNLTVTQPASNLTLSGAAGQFFTVSGVATDPSGVQSVTVNTVGVTVGAGGAFQTTIPLVLGVNSIVVVATDNAAAHTTTTITRTVTLVSTLGPTVTVTDPADGEVIQGDDGYLQQVEGTATSANGISRLTINGVSTPLATDGSFSQVVSLVTGENIILVDATDAAQVPKTTEIVLHVRLVPMPVVDTGGVLTSQDQIRIAEEIQDRGVE